MYTYIYAYNVSAMLSRLSMAAGSLSVVRPVRFLVAMIGALDR